MKRLKTRVVLAATLLVALDGLVIYIIGPRAIIWIASGILGGLLIGWYWPRPKNKKR